LQFSEAQSLGQNIMRRVEQIEKEIEQLSPHEFSEIARWS
jgi:hypothetical protein